MRAFILIATLLCVIACNPQRKLNRLLMKYPELRDTVFIHDTVEAIVEYVQHDTTFLPSVGDTVTIEKERLRVKYVRMKGDTVYISGECLQDTVFVPVSYEVPVIQPAKTVEKMPWWVAPLLLLMAAGLIATAFRK